MIRNQLDAERLGVSRETFSRMEVFAALLEKWTAKINLVSRSSLPHLWERHIRDSIQAVRLAPDADHWADLGSGGGFPGLVVAILATEERPDMRTTLVESDQRKAVFLRTVAREAGARCTVLSERIEAVTPLDADILSARALADLPKLLEYAERHLAPDGTALFPKGASWKKELALAREQWRFDCEAVTSETEPDAVILKIKGVQRV